jgi:hypothetical protein
MEDELEKFDKDYQKILSKLPPFMANLSPLHKQEEKTRGRYLAMAILVERIIDYCLSHYFIPDNKNIQTEFYQLILGGEVTNFYGKAKVLKFLYKNKFPEFNTKYNESIKAVKNFLILKNRKLSILS